MSAREMTLDEIDSRVAQYAEKAMVHAEESILVIRGTEEEPEGHIAEAVDVIGGWLTELRRSPDEFTQIAAKYLHANCVDWL